jgi:Ser/Thr protein kinase RdoA (MazF antagonist)
MSDRSLEAAQHVLAQYPAPLTAGSGQFLGNHGGFSGARLWRIQGDAGPLCLRAWPKETLKERLTFIHRAMRVAHDAGLPFVPAVFSTRDGFTVRAADGRLWDLTTWLPGRADFHERSSAERLAAACVTLAQLHRTWAPLFSYGAGPCPAVQRRIERAGEWVDLVRSGWRPAFDTTGADPVGHWAQLAWNALQGRIEPLPERLAPWSVRNVPLQLCLCDIWHAHVLYQGDTVSGIIDYGSAKVDHVSVDLARLLGSMVGDNAQQREVGVAAYRTIRPLSDDEEELVRVLDQSGTLLAAANWLRWLYHDQERRFEDRDAVAARLATLVQRL